MVYSNEEHYLIFDFFDKSVTNDYQTCLQIIRKDVS